MSKAEYITFLIRGLAHGLALEGLALEGLALEGPYFWAFLTKS